MKQPEFIFIMLGWGVMVLVITFAMLRHWWPWNWEEPKPPVIPDDSNTLKTWPSFFQAVFDGEKNFEVRKADRDFRPGQVWYLREWHKCGGYKGSWVKVRVTYVVHHNEDGPASGIAPGFCVWGFKVLERYNEKLNLHLNDRGFII